MERGVLLAFLLGMAVVVSGCIVPPAETPPYQPYEREHFNYPWGEIPEQNWTNPRYEQILTAALRDANVSLCPEMEDIGNCSIQLRYNARACTPYQSQCFYEIATKTNNEFLCENVSNPLFALYCFEYIALAKNNTVICGKLASINRTKLANWYDIPIENVSLANDVAYCRQKIAVQTLNVSLCEISHIAENNVWEFSCLHDVAFGLNNISICELIEITNEREFCYKGIAEKNKDQSICDMISPFSVAWEAGPLTRDLCYQDVAAAARDPSLCKLVQNSEDQNGCFKMMARLMKDYTLCASIADQYFRDVCYSSVADWTYDKSACQFIQNVNMKHSCLNPL
ncbi:MAG: hypothetical protein ISS93_02120 [Candidatus Aenigmarchaeota archaeon]|nr:hypothetical protein [Candidatus Aenigmarchaeota archaeon]